MHVYMVERSLAGISMDQLAAAQRRAIDTAAEMTAQGTPVRYIRTTFVPGSGRCMCLFAADGEENVKCLNEQAGIPLDKVMPAMDLTP